MKYAVEMVSDGMILHTVFHENCFGHSGSIIGYYLGTLRGCSVGNTKGNDL
jgi:hypothetical protein